MKHALYECVALTSIAGGKKNAQFANLIERGIALSVNICVPLLGVDVSELIVREYENVSSFSFVERAKSIRNFIMNEVNYSKPPTCKSNPFRCEFPFPSLKLKNASKSS